MVPDVHLYSKQKLKHLLLNCIIVVHQIRVVNITNSLPF